MADQKQLKIIKNGVYVWNEWRNKKQRTNINLSEADLSGANLDRANLDGANLDEAYFKNTKNIPEWIENNLDENSTFSQVQFINSIKNGFKNLRKSYLSGAYFKNTKNIPEWIERGLNYFGIYDQSLLINAIKNGFKELSGVTLKDENLSEINLSRANLSNSNLEKTFLIGTNLNKTILINSNLSAAYLSGANMSGADLTNTMLQNSNIREADLNGANLSFANLFGADLSESNLINTNFSNANITAVNLYGTARDDWVITNIKCDYFFSDYEKKFQIPEKRRFIKDEFEERYKNLPTIEYIFNHGFTPIDAFVMDQVVQAINEQQPEIELRGQPRAVFTVLHNDYKDDALKQITNKYERKIKFLEGKNEILKELVSSCINKPQQLIQGKHITIGDNTMGDNINFSGNGNIAFGKDHSTVNQANTKSEANNELLTEIKELKDELSKLIIDQTNREAIDIQFATLENYAKSEKKNTVLMTSTLDLIKTVTQGALGGAMGTGLVEAFNRVGMMFV